MTDILNFFLAHSPDEWAGGVLSFQNPLTTWSVLAILVLVVVAVVLLYRRTTARTTTRLKTVLILLKSLTLAILLLCLLKPVLITSSTQPRDSTIDILVDNTYSMTLPDITPSRSRGETALEMLYGKDGLIAQLEDYFTVRVFAFDRQAHPINGAADLAFSGTKTNLSQALADIAVAMQGLPQAGLVMVTDGADNTDVDPLPRAGIFNARQIPLHVIGLGIENDDRDIEINRVQRVGSTVAGGLLELLITVVNHGYAGLETELLVEDGERVVTSKQIVLGPEGLPQQFTVYLPPQSKSQQIYTAAIGDRKDETNKENNHLPFLLEKSEQHPEILYIEGHPRNEYKFIRRAMESDPAVRLKTYLMTGPQKYLRQNIESPLELAEGYPDSEAELFAYDAVIFGDVAPEFFTEAQLALTQEFVSRRGGGFMMLGGVSAFDDRFIGTPVEDILPIILIRDNELPAELRRTGLTGDLPTQRLFPLRQTDEGLRSLILRLDIDDDANRQLWQDMPMLQGVNATGGAKPGATVLAVHPDLSYQGEALPVLAYERYGRGRTMALMTATTWRWQMLKPHEDTSQERFWRQMLRWLTADAPPPVEIWIEPENNSAGDPVMVRAHIYDETYRPVSQATAWLTITHPGTETEDLPMSADIARPGEYAAGFTASHPGIYQAQVSLSDASVSAAPATRSFLVTGAEREMRGATLNRSALTGIAAAGGGQYYNADTADQLVGQLKTNRAMASVKVQKPVWNIPLIFLLLVTFMGLEWFLRRRKGLS